MLAREMRMVDAQIVAALQNGTAFFASTSLIAIGGALTLLRSTERNPRSGRGAAVRRQSTAGAVGGEDDRARHHLRLCVLQVRLVVSALQLRRDPGRRDAARRKTRTRRRRKPTPQRVGRLCEVAGRHFNRGQRAFFFALGYLGWFISPWLSDGHERRRRRGPVAAPVRVGLAARRCSATWDDSGEIHQDRDRRSEQNRQRGADDGDRCSRPRSSRSRTPVRIRQRSRNARASVRAPSDDSPLATPAAIVCPSTQNSEPNCPDARTICDTVRAQTAVAARTFCAQPRRAMHRADARSTPAFSRIRAVPVPASRRRSNHPASARRSGRGKTVSPTDVARVLEPGANGIC